MYQIRPLLISPNLFSRGLNEVISRQHAWNVLTGNPSQCLDRKNYSRSNRSPRKIAESVAFARTLLTGSSKRDTTLPRLVYLQYPWKYLKVKISLWWFKLFWDSTFEQDQFTLGSKQAAVVLTNLLRDRNLDAIRELTTEGGFKQILKDLMMSQGDPRMEMLKFRLGDIKEAIPVRTHFANNDGHKYCIIDMFFVGMRNTRDFGQTERQKMQEFVKNYDKMNWPVDDEIIPGSNASEKDGKRRVVFAEILARFYRDYGANEKDDWSVAFYKIASFDVLAF